MKELKFLIVHCSATPEGREVSKNEIILWHCAKPPRGNGWSKVGYSDIIHLDGSIESLTDYNEDIFVDDSEVTNGARGFNGVSRHICIIGGLDKNFHPKDTLNEMQRLNLIEYIRVFKMLHPTCKVIKHSDVNQKKPYCPGFELDEFDTY